MTIDHVFVAGAGLMGHGVGQVHAAIGKQVALYEPELARAGAQVWSLVGDRVRDRLTAEPARPATDAVLLEVAEQRLDPFTAADLLLAELGR